MLHLLTQKSILNSTDLLWSTLEQHVPNLPWSQGLPMLPPELYEASSQTVKHKYLATSFSHIPNTTLPPPYTEVISAIYWLIIALDTATQSNTTETYLPELVAYRNWIQHCLLSLPSYNNPNQNSISLPHLNPTPSRSKIAPQPSAKSPPCHCTLSIIRTSLLILSTFIIFPMPSSSGINTRLNNILLACLDCCRIGHDDRMASPATAAGYAKLIVWASTLGALNCGAAAAASSTTAALEAQQKTKFIDYLAFSSGVLGIGSPASFIPRGSLVEAWEDAGQGQFTQRDAGEVAGGGASNDTETFFQELRDIVAGFLWWDSALEGRAREIWHGIM